MGAAPPFPAPTPSHGGPGGPEWGWVLGETQVPRKEGAVGRGACRPSSPPGPAPAASAELSSGLQGLPRHAAPPQARRLTHLPRPGTCSPGNAREFSEDSISQGLREPQNSLDSAPGKAKERLGGWSTPFFSLSLSQPHTDLTWPPTNSCAFIHCEAVEGLGQLETKAKAPW